MSWCMKCMHNEIMLYAFVLSMFMIYGCDVCVCELIYCTAVWIGGNKSLTVDEDMECKSSCLWNWSVDEFPLGEINYVVRETPCIACEILLGNPEKFGDFYRGVITGSFIPLGIKLRTMGDFYGIA